jgi:hypothetical protein
MGGSPVAAVQDASDDADARVVVLVAGSPVDSASDSLPPPPVAATPTAEAKQEPVPVLGPEEPKQEAAAAAAGVQDMAVTVVRDVETGLDASTSDRDGDGAGDKPSWFTPKR